MEQLKLTPLETEILSCLIDLLYAEPGFSDVDATDIASEIGKNIKSIRGALSSLVKKGIVDVEGNESGYQIIYLHSDYYYLHPEWSKTC